MRRVCAILLLAAALAAALPAAATINEYFTAASATATNTAVSFGFAASRVLIVNNGPSAVYITFASTTATTGKGYLNAGESMVWAVNPLVDTPASGVGLICASGETATVRVWAWR